jgi:integrase/recombinase XerD
LTFHSNEAIPLILNFCHWLKEQNKSPGTIATYKREIERYQEWLHDRQADFHQFTKGDIEDYIFFLKEQQKSPATIDKTVGAIRTFAKFLGKPDLIFGITLEPVMKLDFETLTADQCGQLLMKVKEDGNQRDIAIVYLLLYTGIRVSELCSLNRSDVDFIHNQLVIEKADESRMIPLSNEARIQLEKYLESHLSPNAVFISKAGERITERTVQYMLKKYDVNPNKLRHTFCQRLIDSGADIKMVSRLTGIKDLNMIKRYVNKSPMHTEKLGDLVNNLFENY